MLLLLLLLLLPVVVVVMALVKIARGGGRARQRWHQGSMDIIATTIMVIMMGVWVGQKLYFLINMTDDPPYAGVTL